MSSRVVVVAGAVLGLVVGVGLRPTAHHLPDESHGDAELARTVVDVAGTAYSALAVGVVRDGTITTASVGAPLDGRYEVGSISKGVTGLLFVDAVERGEVGEQTRLGDLLDLGSTASADITLGALARQSSGLPKLPRSASSFASGLVATWLARNPYDETYDELVEQLRATKPTEDGPLYSNLGFEALGAALAAATGTSYADLVRERIADPLGLDSVAVVTEKDQLTAQDVQGRDGAGRRQEAWTGEAMSAAGGIRADIGDLATLTAALLDGTAPGASALDPVADFEDGDRIGAAWMTTVQDDGRTVTWHNGATGGFTAWLGMDREAGTGVVVLASSSRVVDDVGLDLLEEVSTP